MAKKQSGRSGLVIAGLGFGVAAGIAAGTLVIAPNLPGGVGSGAGMSATELEAAQQERDINAAQAESADSVVAHLADSTVRGVLEGTPVMVMSTADADSAVVDEVARLAVVAGARDAGRIKLENKFFSQDGADSLKNIIANTLPAGATLSETNRDPGNHAGEALGAALLLHPQNGTPQASEEERAALLQVLRNEGFISYADGTILPAQIVILVTGDSDGSDDAQFPALQLSQFARALDYKGNGAVVAGEIRTASDTGVIGLLRSQPESAEAVSTVDSVNRSWGQIATLLAAREQLDGGSGAYGAAASAEAALPPVPASRPSAN